MRHAKVRLVTGSCKIEMVFNLLTDSFGVDEAFVDMAIHVEDRSEERGCSRFGVHVLHLAYAGVENVVLALGHVHLSISVQLIDLFNATNI